MDLSNNRISSQFILGDNGFWQAYVGKSSDLMVRVGAHENPKSLSSAPNFHHYARDGCMSRFCLLFATVQSSVSPRILQLLENLACLLFKILQPGILRALRQATTPFFWTTLRGWASDQVWLDISKPVLKETFQKYVSPGDQR